MLLDGKRIAVSGDDDLATGLVRRGAEAIDGDGPVDGIVLVVPVDLDERPLAELEPAGWAARCDDVLGQLIADAQEAHRRLTEHGGGRLVFVVPSFGMTGAAGLVAQATVAEGARSLAKSAARQWAADGITVATVARRVAGPVVAISSLPEPTVDDVAATVALLLADEARATTGATLVVDGGTVLAP